jgi:hypothetical protein
VLPVAALLACQALFEVPRMSTNLAHIVGDSKDAPRLLQAYKRAVSAAAAADTCLGLVLAWLARRRRPLDTSVCRQMAPHLRAVQAAMLGCCHALAAVVEDKQTPVAALEQLVELENRWAGFGRRERSAASVLDAPTLVSAAYPMPDVQVPFSFFFTWPTACCSRRALNAATKAAGGSPEGSVVLAVLRSMLYLSASQVGGVEKLSRLAGAQI